MDNSKSVQLKFENCLILKNCTNASLSFCRFEMAKTVGEFQCSMVIKTFFTSIILRRTDENVEAGAVNFIRYNSQIKSHYLNSIQVANHDLLNTN